MRVTPGTASAAVAVMAALASCGGAELPAVSGTAAPAASVGELQKRPKGPVEKCSRRSMARFPGAYTSERNAVVGPFVLIGGAYTDPATVREFEGNKFPALVRNGHRVTVAMSQRTRRGASLGYGPLPQGEVHVRDGHRVVTFKACGRLKDSGSYADGKPVTFWSGFVLARSPRCVPLKVWVDKEPAPRLVTLNMGKKDC